MTFMTAGSDDGENLLVSFADLDDDEALTDAIDVDRSWAIATDDRKALGLFGRVAPHIELNSTPDMVKN